MTACLIVLLTFGVEATATNSSEVSSRFSAASDATPLNVVRKKVTAALGCEAKAKSSTEKWTAIVGLVDIYQRIQADERFETSETLKGLKIKIWSRLDRTRRKLKRQLARKGTPYVSKPPLPEVASAASAHISQLYRSQAGPTPPIPIVVAGRGGGAVNFAQDLIDVIERAISPSIWEANGGPASMAYYPPVHALVVRATDEVHLEVAHLLTMLRAAGGP